MKKQVYVAPMLEVLEIEGEVVMQAVSSDKGTGIKYKGNVSDCAIIDMEADVNAGKDWDIW